MKLVIRILILSLFAGTAAAEEGSRAYFAAQPFGQGFSGSATALQQTDGLSRSNVFGGSIGFSLNDYFMMDLISVNYSDQEYSGDASQNSVSIVNIISELRFGWFGGDFPVKPYGAVGIGASNVSFSFGDNTYPGIDAWGLAWEAGGGIDVPMGKSGVSLGLFYRYRSSVSLANNWNPVPENEGMTEEQLYIYYSGWEASYHVIGIEIRFGGIR
ncbi:MAG: outer membrane beta-barrel protein [Myxococcota bacterium]|nr:outer membrane beta-barrel protein [Myxococcota bacterium]